MVPEVFKVIQFDTKHPVLGGDNVPPLVEIGLTDLPITGGLRPPQSPPPCDSPEVNYESPYSLMYCPSLQDLILNHV